MQIGWRCQRLCAAAPSLRTPERIESPSPGGALTGRLPNANSDRSDSPARAPAKILGAGMRTPPRYISGALALLMSGCAYYDHFDNRVGTYDVVAAQSRDGMILTNVIRASHAEPLSFVQLGQINGSGASAATLGLPPLILGPHVAAATSAATHVLQEEAVFGADPAGGSGFVGNSANISGSTNFTVSPSESKDFYTGLLHEVDPLICSSSSNRASPARYCSTCSPTG